jgi:hypothetical protein
MALPLTGQEDGELLFTGQMATPSSDTLILSQVPRTAPHARRGTERCVDTFHLHTETLAAEMCYPGVRNDPRPCMGIIHRECLGIYHPREARGLRCAIKGHYDHPGK